MYTYHAPSNTVISNDRSFPVEGKHEWKDGQELELGKDFRLLENVQVDIYAKSGTKVKALFVDNKIVGGYDFDKQNAMEYLKPDTAYEIAETLVSDWHTDFYLKEFPGIAFNSVHFVYTTPIAIPPTARGKRR
jgi:hypothetical protein